MSLFDPSLAWTPDGKPCSFDHLPPELKILIISYLDLDPATFRSLSSLNRQNRQLLKTHGIDLVKNAVQRKNRLAGLLALPARPTFKDYLIFQIEERSFRACVITIKRDGAYRDCFTRWTSQDDMEDDEVYESSGLGLMLKAGFYVHYRLARLTSTLEQEDFLMNVSEEAWALLGLFTVFVAFAIRHKTACLVPRPHFPSCFIAAAAAAAESGRQSHMALSLVVDVVLQIVLYTGMHALEDYLTQRHRSKRDSITPELYVWMEEFLANSLEKSVLVKEGDVDSYNYHLGQALNCTRMRLSRSRVPGKDETIKMYQGECPAAKKLCSDPETADKVTQIFNSARKPIGIKFRRKEKFAPQAVLTISGVEAAAQVCYDDLLSKLVEIGVDNRSLAGSELMEPTPLENLKEWKCYYTSVMLGGSVSQLSGLRARLYQAPAQPETTKVGNTTHTDYHLAFQLSTGREKSYSAWFS